MPDPVAYCTAADLLVPSEALSELQPADIQRAIVSASGEANGYISTQIPLPLIQPVDSSGTPYWPPELVNNVAQIATYRAMLMRGYNPNVGQNDVFRNMYRDAVAFFQGVGKGDIILSVKGSNSQAQTQEGTGASSSAFVTQPHDKQAGTYSEYEDFFHDRPSVSGGAGGFRGSGDRGY